MNISADLHTHTIASGHHTTDTVRHLALAAKEKNLEYLGITDHSKGMLCGAKDSYFINLKMLSPKSIYGVKMLYGVEANILSASGELDVKKDVLEKLDYAVASLHKEAFKPSTESANTNAILRAMDNPYVNIIGHAENSEYPVNFPLIAEYATETGTIIELNSASIAVNGYRGDMWDIAKALMRECKRYGTYVSLGSDSHGKEHVGEFERSIEMLEELDFPKEKIVNYDMDLFFSLVNKKRK